jgi:hypothetical protein
VTFEQIDAFENEKQELLKTTMALAKAYTRHPQTMIKFLQRLRGSKQYRSLACSSVLSFHRLC